MENAGARIRVPKCIPCNKTFATASALAQHQRDKHSRERQGAARNSNGKPPRQRQRKKREGKTSSGRKRKKKNAPPSKPPFPGAEGIWVPANEFSGRKSFGFFVCTGCRSPWYSAHAYPTYRQECKSCDTSCFAKYLWRNFLRGRSSGTLRDARDDRPHMAHLCEACRLGVCSVVV